MVVVETRFDDDTILESDDVGVAVHALPGGAAPSCFAAGNPVLRKAIATQIH